MFSALRHRTAALALGVCFILPVHASSPKPGDILSTVVGALLICSGIALIVGLFSNRSHNFWPVLSGFLVAVAYLLIGYFFIRAPELGIFAIAAFIAGLFCVAGVIRLMSWYRQRSMKGSWLQLVIGVLDIVIAWIFLGATPMVSVTLVSTLVGIELIFSAASLFSFASLFVKKQSLSLFPPRS